MQTFAQSMRGSFQKYCTRALLLQVTSRYLFITVINKEQAGREAVLLGFGLDFPNRDACALLPTPYTTRSFSSGYQVRPFKA